MLAASATPQWPASQVGVMDAGREVVAISHGEGCSLSSAEPTPAPSLPLLPGGQCHLLLHS